MRSISKSFICGIMMWVGLAQVSYAKAIDSGKDAVLPVMISADELFYDSQTKTVIANGNVEVIQDGQVLLADMIAYDQAHDRVEARGDVSFMEKNGNVFFSDYVELQDQFKRGLIDNFSARLDDDTLVAAQRAEKITEYKTQLDKAVYSPCPVCASDFLQSPLWQLKADRATIDEQKQRVSYRNAFFEVHEVPIFYTPYLSHPTPDADRKSGFLAPSYSNNNFFGTRIETPFYYNMAPNQDLTVTPGFTGEKGEYLVGEYRHLTSRGLYELDGSIANTDEIDESGNVADGHQIRGHVAARALFSFDNGWDLGFDGKRASDDTYLRRYNLGYEDVLVSRGYVEHVANNRYAILQALSFQGLRQEDDPGTTPLILPQGAFSMKGQPGRYGSQWSLDGNLLTLLRDEGASSRRISLKGSVSVPYITQNGQVLEFKASLRGDGYAVDNVPDLTGEEADGFHDGVVGRVIPQVELSWALPLVRQEQKRQYFIEPKALLVVSPYGGNPDEIPNEDSQDIEFSDDNLFASNLFSGYDVIEDGPRVSYGIRGGVSDDDLGHLDIVIGQHYRVKENDHFTDRTGLDGLFSDYVGRISYRHNKYMDLSYRVRLDKDELTAKRNSVTAGFDVDPVALSLEYIALNESFIDDELSEDKREVFSMRSTLDLSERWSWKNNGYRDLEKGEWISAGTSLLYEGDCVDVLTSYAREFAQDRDIIPATTVSVQLSLKHLGAVRYAEDVSR